MASRHARKVRLQSAEGVTTLWGMKGWVAVLIVLGAGLLWQPFEGAAVDAQPVTGNDAGPEATQLPAPERIVEELQNVRVVMERQQAALEQIQVQLSEQKTVLERTRAALQQAHEEIVLANVAAQSTL